MGAELWREAVAEARRQKAATAFAAEQERVASGRKLQEQLMAREEEQLANERELQRAALELEAFLASEEGALVEILLRETNEQITIYQDVPVPDIGRETARLIHRPFTLLQYEHDTAYGLRQLHAPPATVELIRRWMGCDNDRRRPHDFMPWLIGELDEIAEKFVKKTKQK